MFITDTAKNKDPIIWYFKEVSVYLHKVLTIMLTDIKDARKLAGFRLPLILIEKIKIAANNAGTSVNDYVCTTLANATEDIETPAEKEMRIRETKAFLDKFAGSWVSSENDEDLKEVIKKNKTISSPVNL